VNFLENRSLFGDREALRKAKARFSRIAQQYTFHAVARLIEGWLSGELGDAEGKDRIFLDVKGMMNDREIAGAYGKYFSWDTPTTNEYRRWLEQQKEPEKNVSYEKILTESNRRID
jgi:hypothetical protein